MRLLIVVILTSLMCGRLHAQASASLPIKLTIESQTLQRAIYSWAEQTGYQVLILNPREAQRQSAKNVKGYYTPEGALRMLLAGSNFRYVFTDSHTVTIQTAPDEDGAPSGQQSLRFLNESAVSPQPPASQSSRGGSGPVGAESQSDASYAGIQEILVTAQKRQERSLDVPISIVAIDSATLDSRNIRALDDLAMAVPGLSIQSDGSTTRQVTLRGISNRFGSTSSLVGIYLDEAAVTGGVTSQLDLRTYDLERIEVLRGPQGTLYGDGSAGGTVRFITKNPVLDSFAFKSDFSTLFTQDGSPSEQVDAVVNVPLVQDVLGLRLAGTYDHEGGWIDQPVAGRSNINGQDLKEVRLKGLWLPTADMSVTPMVVIHRNNSGLTFGEDRNGDYTQVLNQTSIPRAADNYDIYNLTVTYDLGTVHMLNTATYIKQDKDVRNSGAPLQILAAPDELPPLEVLQSYTVNSRTFNDELRFSSPGSGPWQWTIGAFYRHLTADTNNSAFIDLPEAPGTPLPDPSVSILQNGSKSWAGFADTSYKLIDPLTLGVGVRYFKDQERLTTDTVQEGTFTATSPRVHLDYKIRPDINTYASFAKGFRSGGFNAFDQPSFGPEVVRTFELGTKMSLLNNTVGIDAAIFYSKYTGYQVAGILPPPTPPLNIYRNAGEAELKGIEWDFEWRPTRDWTLGINGDYIGTEFTKIDVADTTYDKGDPLDLFPRLGYTVFAQRNFVVGVGHLAYLRLDFNQQGRETYRNRSVNGPSSWYFNESDVIKMLNLHANVSLLKNLTMSLFAQNLLNDRGSTDPTQGLGVSGFDITTRPRPRTFGINFAMEIE